MTIDDLLEIKVLPEGLRVHPKPSKNIIRWF